LQETIVGGSKDFSPELTKVKAFHPDVLFFIATAAPDQAIGVRQMKELGINATFFGTEGARDKKDFIEVPYPRPQATSRNLKRSTEPLVGLVPRPMKR
ncbi:MAG: hypothetical protein JRH08_11850, partial [Deltaproteobacteria bacterium]|nr:hypothetical protein [Deltaproteobacteria bacterium]